MQSIESKNKFIELSNFLNSLNLKEFRSFNIDNLSGSTGIIINIEPSTENKKFEGMQINYFKHETQIFGSFEVSEYQAGKKENELHIFSDNQTLEGAIKCLLKGNKRNKKEILKIYK